MKHGDTVTQRGVWLPATVAQVGDQVVELRWINHAKHGMPELSFVPVGDVIAWDKALLEGLGKPVEAEEQQL